MSDSHFNEVRNYVPAAKLQLYLEQIEQNLGAETRHVVEKSIQNGHMGEGILSQLSGYSSNQPTLPPDVSRREAERRR